MSSHNGEENISAFKKNQCRYNRPGKRSRGIRSEQSKLRRSLIRNGRTRHQDMRFKSNPNLGIGCTWTVNVSGATTSLSVSSYIDDFSTSIILFQGVVVKAVSLNHENHDIFIVSETDIFRVQTSKNVYAPVEVIYTGVFSGKVCLYNTTDTIVVSNNDTLSCIEYVPEYDFYILISQMEMGKYRQDGFLSFIYCRRLRLIGNVWYLPSISKTIVHFFDDMSGEPMSQMTFYGYQMVDIVDGENCVMINYSKKFMIPMV